MHVQPNIRKTFPFRSTLWAHVPEPPEHDPSVPPEAPPPLDPGREVDLPPREIPNPIHEPGTPNPGSPDNLPT